MIVRSTAKVNLTLDVVARRADGYHELQSVVHTVGLWDTIQMEFAPPNQFSIQCNDAQLETADNLCIRAVKALRRASEDVHGYKARWSGMHITLHKQIPTGAGLGGGSGNAAAVLRAMNTPRYFAEDVLSEAELHQVALSLGADVPLFLEGGCVLMEGIGEKLTPLPALQGWLVIVQGAQTLSTPRIFGAWDESGAASCHGTPAMLRAVQEFRARGISGVAEALLNDLSQSAQNCGVDVDDLKARLMALGARGASMTGSGSAVFGLFEDESGAHQAAQMWHTLHDGAAERVWVAPFVGRGIELNTSTETA